MPRAQHRADDEGRVGGVTYDLGAILSYLGPAAIWRKRFWQGVGLFIVMAVFVFGCLAFGVAT